MSDIASGAGRRTLTLPHLSMPGLAGLLVVATIVLAALLAPLLAPHDPSRIVGKPFEEPGLFLLGTDVVGRDLLSRLLYGARLTLLVSFAATTIGFLVGVAWGFAAAELRGYFDEVTQWIVNILLSFPPLMLGLLIVAALSSSLTVLILAIALIQLPRVVRMARSIAVDISVMPYIEAARLRGEGLAYILRREILPNSWRPMGVEYGLRLTYSTLFISGLSFLGVGIQPPEADWGLLVRENLPALQQDLYLATLIPAAAIGVLGIALNLVIDWLSDEAAASIPQELK